MANDRSFKEGLLIAASVLDDVAAGRPTEKMQCLCGAMALTTYIVSNPGQFDRDIYDARGGLDSLATGRPLDLNDAGRRRAAHLADCVRHLAESEAVS